MKGEGSENFSQNPGAQGEFFNNQLSSAAA